MVASYPETPLPGWVHILQHSSMQGLVKIDLAYGEPAVRAKKSSGTGSPVPFRVIHAVATDDCKELESRVHQILKRYRSHRREFFRIEPAFAKVIVDRVSQDMTA